MGSPSGVVVGVDSCFRQTASCRHSDRRRHRRRWDELPLQPGAKRGNAGHTGIASPRLREGGFGMVNFAAGKGKRGGRTRSVGGGYTLQNAGFLSSPCSTATPQATTPPTGVTNRPKRGYICRPDAKRGNAGARRGTIPETCRRGRRSHLHLPTGAGKREHVGARNPGIGLQPG